MPNNIPELLIDSIAAHPDRIATRELVDDTWLTRSYRELGEAIDASASRLVAEGIRKGDRVAIFAPNSPQWTVTDFAVLSIGAVVVPIYQTSTPDQARAILDSSGTRWLFCGSALEADRVAEVRDDLPGLERVVVFDDEVLEDDPAPEAYEEVASRRAAVGPDDLATLIYTSGTTGTPKGVMLTHGAFLSEIEAVLASFDITPQDTSLCFLPLAHALERAWTFIVLSSGAMNTYLANPRELATMMPRARTTMMVMVPKVYETVLSTVRDQAASPAKKRILDWAIATGLAAQRAGRDGLARDRMLRGRLALADRLVLSKVRHAIGGQKKVMVAGGAPIRLEVEEFFWACGMVIYTGYGMTEAAPLMTYNSPASVRFGSVGKPMPGSELRVVPVPGYEDGEGDGEIEFRGPNVMVGYWHDEEATAQAFDDGWLRTGDIGHFDVDGNLVITDRLKDLIVTQQGKNIAPAPIEAELSTDPMIAHAVLVGDDRPCVTVLISPDVGALEAWAEAHAIAYESQEELLEHPAVLDELRHRVERVSAKLPHQEKIRDLRVVLGEFSMENGLLTPTLKVRRRAVEQKFADVVDDMYERIAAGRKAAKAAAGHARDVAASFGRSDKD
ncbi:long-chain acyl-CoA synthetase [Raineyella antarctica]|uniref:Acyl-CoA synthetase n=1 Tax=Raineyella antarctica TaxID=1577474 RepID=A0A1G6HDV0_9ACTN|nr:long-chain fatty acid--CoA ligase [Raineyella antarctica]SDB92391.1 long-chain acyl-CoA synthetase [Raineyella antarctica]